MKNFSFRTVSWVRGRVRIIDQTFLPGKVKYIFCANAQEAREAIKSLRVRGAPAIGIMAAYGLILGIRDRSFESSAALLKTLKKTSRYLESSRPTAVNLSWALKRMEDKAESLKALEPEEIKKILLEEADNILEEDALMCESIGKHGSLLLKDGMTVLTYCNAGALATGGIGTALGVIYTASREGKKIKVYACETRPLLQGARLTAWELKKNGIEVTLVCDNMAGDLMSRNKINGVIVGADRISSGGDVANKVGTYGLAVLARYHRVPFWVAAPSSTIDLSMEDGNDIPIEQRGDSEVKNFGSRSIAPLSVPVYNPSFDVTPRGLIDAIITERGIIIPPFKAKLARTKKGRGN